MTEWSSTLGKAKGVPREQAEGKWLDKSLAAMRAYMGVSVPLSGFMKQFNDKGKLSKAERLQLVQQALVLIEMNYVHLPLKRAIHGADPVQRLRRLTFQLGQIKEDDLPGEIQFHNQMHRIFTSTRDIHTNYTLPAPFNSMTAYLPFLVEEYFDSGHGRRRRSVAIEDAAMGAGLRIEKEPHYLVSHVASGFRHPSFKKGVEVLYWNGVPIQRAVEINGEKLAGSNLEARFAHGLDLLTIRPLNGCLPPEEMWVIVTYLSEQGDLEEIKLEWRVFTSKLKKRAIRGATTGDKAKAAVNIRKDALNRAKKLMFKPGAAGSDKKPSSASSSLGNSKDGALNTTMPEAFSARPLRTSNGDFGYIRIFTFSLEYEDQVDKFVNEFARLIKLLPQEGLIIDVRGNGGGEISAAERLLQFLTHRHISPTLFEIINTPLNLEICRLVGWPDWAESIAQGLITGASHSQGFPITSEESCNAVGQIYYGPVLLITDALCYSATDMFAASFQDHEIGEILGTSGNTGAGGANVLRHKDLTEWLSVHPASSPFRPLPRGITMRVAFRRSVRAGRHMGRPLEELGVIPDRRYYMTKDDVLYGNRDLINHAARILAEKTAHLVSVEIETEADEKRTLIVTTMNISHLDVHLNQRPHGSYDVTDGTLKLRVKVPRTGSPEVLLEGFKGGRRVAVCRKDIS